jgi:hypothetical protein
MKHKLRSCPFCKNVDLEIVLEKKNKGSLPGREASIVCKQLEGCGKIVQLGWYPSDWSYEEVIGDVTNLWNSRKSSILKKVKGMLKKAA